MCCNKGVLEFKWPLYFVAFSVNGCINMTTIEALNLPCTVKLSGKNDID